jgi:hypothetical protein
MDRMHGRKIERIPPIYGDVRQFCQSAMQEVPSCKVI